MTLELLSSAYELHDSPALWGLFASAFVSSTLAPGGSEAFLAYLVNRAEISPSVLLLTATVGNTLGAVTTWLLGLWAAQRWPLDKLRDEGRRRAVHTVRRWGVSVLLLSWLPIVGDGFCFAAGWLRMSFAASLIAIALGKLGRYAAIVYLFA
jgi:membrane protein YqaA with SNARE-associated domain